MATLEETPSPTPEDGPDSGRWWSSDRAALVTFIVLIVGAFPLILLYLGNQRWFFLDEWAFLVGRQGTSVDDLTRPHNEHLSTLPVLVYKVLWPVFGLRTYLPYQAVVVALHLTAVVLLRQVMRRSGVRAWVATITATVLILFGSGSADIVNAFQMSFVASVVFGLTQLLLIDHDGPWDRRDWFALGAGVAALLCSGVGVTMVVVVGIAAVIRHGWKVAAAQTVPLGVLYLAWYAVERPSTGNNPLHASRLDIARHILEFVTHGFTAAFRMMGQYRTVGALLGVILIAGWVVGCRDDGVARFVRRASGPLALALGSLVMLTVSGWGRWFFGKEFAAESRYVYLTTALLLPALAVAINSLGGRWRLATPLALAVLLIGVPGNVRQFRQDEGSAALAIQRQVLLSIAASPLAQQVSPELVPDPLFAPEVTVGWLLEQARSGQIPGPGEVPAPVLGQAVARLGLQQVAVPYTPVDCEPTTTEVVVSPEKGETIVLDGGFAGISVWNGQTWSTPARYNVSKAHVFVTQLPDLTFRLTPAGSSKVLMVCR